MKYIILLRPSHWVKNLFLLIPIFFGGELFNIHKLYLLLLGILAFNFICSSVYILNDYIDVESDKKHPEKRKRPIASGEVSKKSAIVVLILASTIGELIGGYLKPGFVIVLNIYFLVNILYSIGLKAIAILDILLLSFGFVLRIIAGGIIAGILISEWLIVMVFLLSLFLAITKRRDDVLIKINTGEDMRMASKSYNLDYLNILISFVSSSLIIAYLIYTLTPETIFKFGNKLYYTSIFVLSGLLRYLKITFIDNNSGSPVKIFYQDLFIQISILLWVICFFTIIYINDILSLLFYFAK